MVKVSDLTGLWNHTHPLVIPKTLNGRFSVARVSDVSMRDFFSFFLFFFNSIVTQACAYHGHGLMVQMACNRCSMGVTAGHIKPTTQAVAKNRSRMNILLLFIVSCQSG